MATKRVCPKCLAVEALQLGKRTLERETPDVLERTAAAALAYIGALREIDECELEVCAQHRPTPEEEIAKLQTVLESMTAAGLLRRG